MQLDKQRKREYCEVLGITETADEDAVKKAYKKLALECHPDRPSNKGKEEESANKFRKVTEAYEKLISNSSAMSAFKNVFKSSEIHSSLEHFLFTTGNSFNFTNSNSTSDMNTSRDHLASISKIFKKGQSLRTTLKIKFDESLYGCSKVIEFTRTLVCQKCGGMKVSHNPNLNNICRDCSGKGVLKAVINGGSLGGSSITTACPTCNGTPNITPSSSATSISSPSIGSPITPSSSATLLGSPSATFSPIHRNNSSFSKRADFSNMVICSECNGNGKITERKTCTIEVPPGVTTGMQKIFDGEGDESEDKGGASGDLIVCFEVENHAFYMRKGDDATCSLPIQFTQAALGAVMEFPSLYAKKLEVNIRAGSQHNEIIKIEGEGFINPEKQKRGDLYLQLLIIVPKTLDENEKKLLQQLQTLPSFRPLFKSS